MKELLAQISAAGNHLAQVEEELYDLTVAVSNAFDGTAKFDVDGRYIYVNQPYAVTFGYEPEDLLGRSWQDTVYADDLEAHAKGIKECRIHGRSVLDLRGVKANGEIFWKKVALVRIPPIDRSERYHGFYAFVRDVTESRRADQALRDSEERFRLLTEHSADVIKIVAPDGIILYESPPVERVLGFSTDEMIGRSVFDWVHPDDIERTKEVFALLLLQPNSTTRLEVRYRHKNGDWRVLEAQATNLVHIPSVNGIAINCRDVTEHRKIEDDFLKTQHFVNTLIDKSALLVYILDVVQTVVTYVNSDFTGFLGKTEKQIQTMGPQFLPLIVHPDDIPALMQHLVDLRDAEEGETFEFEQRVRHVSGEWRWLSVRERIFTRDKFGKPVQVLTIAQDITLQKQQEEDFRQTRLLMEQKVKERNADLYVANEFLQKEVNRLDAEKSSHDLFASSEMTPLGSQHARS